MVKDADARKISVSYIDTEEGRGHLAEAFNILRNAGYTPVEGKRFDLTYPESQCPFIRDEFGTGYFGLSAIIVFATKKVEALLRLSDISGAFGNISSRRL